MVGNTGRYDWKGENNIITTGSDCKAVMPSNSGILLEVVGDPWAILERRRCIIHCEVKVA